MQASSLQPVILSPETKDSFLESDDRRPDIIDEPDGEYYKIACGKDGNDPEETCEELAKK